MSYFVPRNSFRNFPLLLLPLCGAGRLFSHWAKIPLAPPDKILGLTEAFRANTASNKVDLGVGAYRTDDGKPFVLESVREAERRILSRHLDHEYAGIAGVQSFLNLSIEFVYGHNSTAIKDSRIAAIQSISGTGGCRVAAEFFSQNFGRGTKIYIPSPTWPNHINILKQAGLTHEYYPYYDAVNKSLNFNALMDFLHTVPENSVILLHVCAHNPTGCDPSKSQWDAISSIMKQRYLIPFLDCAYQGFASGDPETDAYAVRKFVSDGHQFVLSQSFAKNFGLYGERIGAVSVVTSSSEEKERVLSQLKQIARPMYSNPPVYGARLVAEILGDSKLCQLWAAECGGMATRIQAMRILLRENIEKLNRRPNSWRHITDQIGMFCYTGLDIDQVLQLAFILWAQNNGCINSYNSIPMLILILILIFTIRF